MRIPPAPVASENLPRALSESMERRLRGAKHRGRTACLVFSLLSLTRPRFLLDILPYHQQFFPIYTASTSSSSSSSPSSSSSTSSLSLPSSSSSSSPPSPYFFSHGLFPPRGTSLTRRYTRTNTRARKLFLFSLSLSRPRGTTYRLRTNNLQNIKSCTCPPPIRVHCGVPCRDGGKQRPRSRKRFSRWNFLNFRSLPLLGFVWQTPFESGM